MSSLLSMIAPVTSDPAMLQVSQALGQVITAVNNLSSTLQTLQSTQTTQATQLSQLQQSVQSLLNAQVVYKFNPPYLTETKNQYAKIDTIGTPFPTLPASDGNYYFLTVKNDTFSYTFTASEFMPDLNIPGAGTFLLSSSTGALWDGVAAFPSAPATSGYYFLQSNGTNWTGDYLLPAFPSDSSGYVLHWLSPNMTWKAHASGFFSTPGGAGDWVLQTDSSGNVTYVTAPASTGLPTLPSDGTYELVVSSGTGTWTTVPTLWIPSKPSDGTYNLLLSGGTASWSAVSGGTVPSVPGGGAPYVLCANWTSSSSGVEWVLLSALLDPRSTLAPGEIGVITMTGGATVSTLGILVNTSGSTKTLESFGDTDVHWQ